MNKNGKIIKIIGATIVIATILIFIIANPGIYLSTVLGLGFLLYAEIIFLAGIIFINKYAQKSSDLLTKSGMGVPLTMYAIVVFIVSLFYMFSVKMQVQGFLIVQIMLLVVTVLVIAVIGIFSASVERKERDTIQACAAVKGYETELLIIREQTDKKEDINRLIEAVRFSDSSLEVDADAELQETIFQLKQMSSEQILDEEWEQMIKKIGFLIQKRNAQTQSAKQGRI
jgi:hypothetical protein